jgi:hypothetical protein
MSRPGNAAANRIYKLFTSTSGVNSILDTLSQIENIRLEPLTEKQIVTRNVSAELSDRSAEATYPAVFIYCDKLANLLTEKFRRFSGKAHMVVEVRLSQDRMDGLEKGLELYVDAITQILEQNRGEWGEGMYYTGGYEVAFGPVKHGGRNFIQTARITFEVGASSN